MTRFSLLLALAAGALGSCSPDDGPPEISVAEAWARPTVAGQSSAAAYATIANSGGADRLLSAASAATAGATLHSTEVTDGVARMRPQAEGIPVPAGATVKLAPGATHIMLTGLKAPLQVGDSFELRLRFERSGEKIVTARVVDAAATGAHEGH